MQEKTVNYELRRTLLHLSIPLTLLIALIPHSQYIYLGIFVLLFISETIRLRSKRYHSFLMKLPIVRSLMRKEEKRQMFAATGLTLGLAVTSALLPIRLFCLSIITLTLADPSGRIMGKRFGKRKICEGNPKTLVGFCTVWAVSSVLFSLFGLSPVHVVTDSFIVAYMEAFSRHKPFFFDDNAIIPISLALIWM